METPRHHINTGREGFGLINSVGAIAPDQMTGRVRLSNPRPFEIIEAFAQTGALHVRYLRDFEQHAFLLSIKQFTLFDTDTGGKAIEMEINASLLVQTQSAFTYELTGTAGGIPLCSGQFSFATVAYDQRFQQDKLKAHYRSLFSCLCKSRTE